MGIRNQNSTSYVHPDEPNLLNIHKAMTYDDTGVPHLRVFLGTDTVTITGDVNLVDKVKLWDGTNNLIFEQPTNDGESGQWSIPTENYNMVFNGSTWDRMRGNINDGVLTKVTNFPAFPTEFTANQGSAGSTAWKVDIGTNGTVTLASGSQTIGNVKIVDSAGNQNSSDHPLYVSGTVTANVTFPDTLEISNDVGHPIPISRNTTVNSDTNPIYTAQAADTYHLTKFVNSPTNLQMDMTERLRVAQPSNSWWYAPTVDKDGDLRYIESATGANAGSVFVQNLSSINMSSGTDANGSFIRISRRRHKLRPGVSMLCAFSINWNGFVPDGNVTKRVGMFTQYNGVFFEMTGDLQIVIRRRLTDGTLYEKRIARADFNLDPLDGVGDSVYDLRPIVKNTSAITAYVSKTPRAITGDGTVYQVVFTVADPSQFYVSQKGRITGVSPTLYNGTVMVTAISGSNVTFVYNQDPGVFSSLSSAKFDHTTLHNQFVFGFDFNGSRATNIRFFIDGPLGRKAIHEEQFGGTLSTPFANAPAISTRYEIFNTGSPSRLPNFTASSELVNVEAESELNPGFGTARNTSSVAIVKSDFTEYALLAVGLRAGEPYQRADLQVQGLQITDFGNVNPQNSGMYEFRVLLNPTLSAWPTPTNIGKASRQWSFANGTTITDPGVVLYSGYATSVTQLDIRTALNFLNLGSNIDYTDADRLVVTIQLQVNGNGNGAMRATMNFVEAL